MAVTIDGNTGMTTPYGIFSDASGNVGIGTSSTHKSGYISWCKKWWDDRKSRKISIKEKKE